MSKKGKYVFKCPRCGQETSTNIKPIEVVCENYEDHHSNRSFVMVLVDKPNSIEAD